MTLFPETKQADAASTELLAAAVPVDLGAPTEKRATAPSGPQAPVSVRRLVIRFALAGIPVLAAAIVITAIASVRIGTKLGIEDAKRVNYVSALLVQDQVLDDGLLMGDPESITAVDSVREHVHRPQLVGEGEDPRRRRPHPVLQRGQAHRPAVPARRRGAGRAPTADVDVEAEISDLSKEENTLETEDRLLEVYRRVRTPDGTPLLFETYFRYDDVRRVGRDVWSQFAPIAVGALLVLALVQIPFAISLARRLRAGQRQRERLLQHAIESSDAERRRIASDLHDGAVQDLTGVSMSLSARIARPRPTTTPVRR